MNTAHTAPEQLVDGTGDEGLRNLRIQVVQLTPETDLFEVDELPHCQVPLLTLAQQVMRNQKVVND
jgi:hypothetical protein